MINRELYMRQIQGFIDKPVIKVITGMRRSGKSALLKLTIEALIEKGVRPENIISMNFESLQYEDIADYKLLYEFIRTKIEPISGKVYLVLDEIQDVLNWEKATNSFLVDFNCDIYITGSNAKLLSSELATYIAGRYVEIVVYPLSFAEYLDFVKAYRSEADQNREAHFSDYLRFGGLPGIHMMNWEAERLDQYLEGIYNSVLLKDVISRNHIRDTALLEKIIHFLMDNIGNTFSAKTVSDFLKSQGRKLSTETVYNYLKALEGAYVIYKVPRYDIKGKRLLETQEKYFLNDLGIRHAIMGYRENDIAGILENVVYLELLRRGYTITIGKQDTKEVDFVAVHQDKKLYVQVCYLLTDETVTKREFAPLLAIDDHYEKLVLSMDSLFDFNIEGVKRRHVIDFLLDNK